MRIDRPRERAASGSFFDPNSTISTTATISTFHGLSNRSPITSVLLKDVVLVSTVSRRGGFRTRDCH
jgi:hypothetical protein